MKERNKPFHTLFVIFGAFLSFPLKIKCPDDKCPDVLWPARDKEDEFPSWPICYTSVIIIKDWVSFLGTHIKAPTHMICSQLEP